MSFYNRSTNPRNKGTPFEDDRIYYPPPPSHPSKDLLLSQIRTRDHELHNTQKYTAGVSLQPHKLLLSDSNAIPDPEIVQSRPERPKSPVPSEISLEAFDLDLESQDNLQILKFSSNIKTDTTLHFVLDATDDIEGQLEELGRLRRWGHFKEALEYFESNLEKYLELPLVLIEYTNLLLEQGAYQKLTQSRLKAPTKVKSMPGNGAYQPDLYRIHFDLIENRARFSFQSIVVDDFDAHKIDESALHFHQRIDNRSASNSRVGPRTSFDYTEVQIIRNQLELLADIGDRDRGEVILPSPGFYCYEEIYNDLLLEGRIWEACDFLGALFRYFGSLETWKILYAENSSEVELKDCVDRLLQDWSVDDHDESTELAMLFILVQMVYDFTPRNRYGIRKDEAADMIICLQKATSIAVNIQQHSPHLKSSRPYLQWIIAKECFDRRSNCSPSYRKRREQHFENAFGIVISDWDIPIYLPVGSGNRGWPASDPKFPFNDELKWVLSTSRELGDYQTESMCLRELICRAEDPLPLFAELETLQKDRQGNNIAHFDSSLSRYLLANDNMSRRQLICELEEAIKKFKPAAEDDVCIYKRRCGLVVLNGLFHSFPEYTTECLQNENTIHTLGRKISLSRNQTDTLISPNRNHQKHRLEERVKTNGRPLPLYNEEKQWYEDEIRRGLRRIEELESKERQRLSELEQGEKTLQRQISQLLYQEPLAVEKKEIQTKRRQESEKIRDNSSKTGAAGQGNQPEQIKRQPTVTDFEEPTLPPTTLSKPLVYSAEVEEDSDEDAGALAMIPRPNEPNVH